MHGKQILSIAVLVSLTTAQTIIQGRDAEPQTIGFGRRDAEPQTIANGRRAEPTSAAVIDFAVVERDAEAQSAGFPCCSKRDADPEHSAEAEPIFVREAQAQPTARDVEPQTIANGRHEAVPQTFANGRRAELTPAPVIDFAVVERDAAPQSAGFPISGRDATPQSAGFPISARDAEAQSAGFPISGRDAQSVTARDAQAQPTPRDAAPQSGFIPCCSGRDAGPEPTADAQPLLNERAIPTFETRVLRRDAEPQEPTKREAQAEPTS